MSKILGTLRAFARAPPKTGVEREERSEGTTILPTYRRFDQRNQAFPRSTRDSSSVAFQYFTRKPEAELRHVNRGDAGLTLLDYAFAHAALAVAEASGARYGEQNRGFYSWSPYEKSESPLRGHYYKFGATPETNSRVVKRAAEHLGAALVGICRLDRRWVYSHNLYGKEIAFEDVNEWYETEEKIVIPNSHENVVVMAVEMELNEMRHAPHAVGQAGVGKGYSKMAAVTLSVAQFIRGLGWHAIPCGNDTALSIPLAIDAGLGQQGRHGRLITKKHGPLVRICKVFTDLPLAVDKPVDIGVTRFCQVCKKCAAKCPARALPMGERTFEGPSKSNNPGVLKWYEDADKCLDYFAKIGTTCGICLRVCPFSKPPTRVHDLTKWFVQHVPIVDPFWVHLDDAMGYGAPIDPGEFWNPIDTVRKSD